MKCKARNSNAGRQPGFCRAALAALLIPAAAWAQGAGGLINGTVTDASGAVIPGATVEIVNAETGVVTTAETGVNGVYYMPNMPIGEYDIAAESDGFKRAEVKGLRLNVASEIQQSFALEIGAVSEVVEVNAAQVQVQTTSGSVGSAVQIEQMVELPLAGRNIFNLVNLVPGAYRSRNGNISIGGGRTRSAGSYLDGINNTRGGLGVQNIEMTPPIDSMHEFKVEVNSMGAEYGRSSAGVVMATTRNGTNGFHGTAYHFVRNDVFDAIGWNQDTKPVLRRNQGGFSLGGPVAKNKTFFFVNSDLFLNPRTVNRIRSVGRNEYRTGDFSRAFQNRQGRPVLMPIHDPLTRKAGTFTRPRLSDPFPNNTIPMDRFDPVAVAAFGYLPEQNRTPNNVNNLAGNWHELVRLSTTRTYNTFRVDHNYTQKWRTFLRTIISDNRVNNNYSQGYGVADPNGANNRQRRQNWGLNNTYTFSPTFFVAALVGFNRVYINNTQGDCCETNYGQLLGLPGLEKGGESFPRFSFNGRIPMTNIGGGYAKRIAAFTNFDYEANFTRIQGDHTMKFGGKYTSFQGNELARPQPSGNWNANNGGFTRKWPARGGGNVNTGIPMADFLLGHVWNLDARIAAPIGKRIKYWSGYFQDDWRVTPRLTLNVGVRYETETPIYEVGGRMNGFCEFCAHPLAGQNGIPEGAIGKVLFPNRDGTGKYLWDWDKNNIAPRFGFAYRLKRDSSMVLRGGFGIFYGNPYDRNSIQPGRAGFDNIFRRRGGFNSYLRNGLPSGALDDIPEEELNGGFGAVGTRFPTSTIQYWNQAREMPYSQNFNLTLQMRWKDVLWEFGFLGALARHQAYNNINVNQIHPDDLAAANAPGVNDAMKERLFLPWTAWEGSIDQIQLMSPNWGISNFYAATFKSEKRYQNGMGWTIAYTHTQWIDNIRFIGNADTFGNNHYPQTVYDIRNERSSSGSRLPHRVVLAPIYDLPFGRGRRWGKQWPKALNAIAGGWQVSSIGTIQSGGFVGATVNGGGNIKGDLTAGHVLRPNLTGAPFESPRQSEPADGVTGLYWLNPDAFEIPDRFTLGNASRNLPGIRGPWLFDMDMLLAKNFWWKERVKVQLRAEVFSMTNTPQFALPNSSVGSGNFGIVTGVNGGRRVMEFGFRVTF